MLFLQFSVYSQAEQKSINKNILDKHYGSLSFRGGYHSLLEKFDDLTTQGGGQLGISGGYELRYSWFFLSAGVDVSYWMSDAQTKAYKFDRNMYDTQGKPMTFHYDLAPSTEHSYGLTAAVPIMVGVNYNGFYAGAGVSVGYHILSRNRVSRAYTGYATYDQYFEDFVDMPNHFYTNYKVSNDEPLKMTIPVKLIGEIGYDVLYGYSYSSYSRDKVLKIGAYVEYGLMNAFSNKQDGPLWSLNEAHPLQLNVYSYYTNKATTTYKVIPMSVGVKITLLLRIPTRSCHCN